METNENNAKTGATSEPLPGGLRGELEVLALLTRLEQVVHRQLQHAAAEDFDPILSLGEEVEVLLTRLKSAGRAPTIEAARQARRIESLHAQLTRTILAQADRSRGPADSSQAC